MCITHLSMCECLCCGIKHLINIQCVPQRINKHLCVKKEKKDISASIQKDENDCMLEIQSSVIKL